MQENCKQDKEVGINPDFDEAEAGNPLCPAGGTEEVKNAELIFAIHRGTL